MQFRRLHGRWNRIVLKTLHFCQRFQIEGTGVGQVSDLAYHGTMDAPAHQSWHLWQVPATPKPPPFGLQQTGQVELYIVGRQST